MREQNPEPMAEKVSIIIPTYNERKNIRQLIKELSGNCKGINLEIIIVDDNSPDGTANEAARLSARYPLLVIRRKGKFGLSSAVVEGFKAASGSILGVMDGDLSHPPEAASRMIRIVLARKADFAIGSRNAKGGKVEVWPFHRKLTSAIATMLAWPLTPVKDPMSGFFFLRTQVVEGIKFKAHGYKICLEILVKGRYGRLVEVPYIFRNRLIGKSKMGWLEVMQYLQSLPGFYAYKAGKAMKMFLK
jgi:dolichol-phosphate mannosyltransferase